MSLRSSLGVFRLGVLLALGLPVAACSGDSTEDGTLRPCTNSTPVSGQPNLEQCSEGPVHRTQPAQCQSQLPRPDACDPSLGGGTAACTMDAECTASPHGHCGIQGQILDCSCQYGCVKDSDCAADEVCNCGTPVGACAKATCATDADCGGGALCVQTRMTKCSWTSGYACQRRSDSCTTDEDCAPGDLCTLTDAGRTCLKNDCPVAGRPFLVADHARVAPVAQRKDWAEDFSTRLADIPDAARERLTAHWTKIGQMEHASVAAFARFTLQLLSLGAPASLVAEAQVAMADETRHARTCFGLASAYAKGAVGPGPLEIDNALGADSVEDIVRLTFREGCVGETAAAHEVRQCAKSTKDPFLKVALEEIADDEQRHALTAWKFVKWAMEEFGAPARIALEQELARLRTEPAVAPPVVDEHADHGVLSEDSRLWLRAEAVRAVVLPCAQALLEPVAAESTVTAKATVTAEATVTNQVALG